MDLPALTLLTSLLNFMHEWVPILMVLLLYAEVAQELLRIQKNVIGLQMVSGENLPV